MSTREAYVPGAATGAKVEKREGDSWTLVLVRDLRHAPTKVWEAITDPEQLREWAPFDSDTNLGATGTSAKLTTIGAPQLHVTETKVRRAEAPKVLEYKWGQWEMRWELEPQGTGTRLTLWADIDRRYIAMGASGWHICIDVMDRLLSGAPLGRTVGPAAMKVEGWQRLMGEYVKLLRVEAPSG